MRDVLYVLGTLAFFALSVLLVRACDVIVGPDEIDGDVDVFDDEPEGAATTVEVAA